MNATVKTLGFKGALVNGHTHGTYYDLPAYDAFWEAMQDLDVPFYLHPIDHFQVPLAYADRPELTGAVWGWGVETASHALRLLFSGVFDRFPRLKIILGHMGEGLPMLLLAVRQPLRRLFTGRDVAAAAFRIFRPQYPHHDIRSVLTRGARLLARRNG